MFPVEDPERELGRYIDPRFSWFDPLPGIAGVIPAPRREMGMNGDSERRSLEEMQVIGKEIIRINWRSIKLVVMRMRAMLPAEEIHLFRCHAFLLGFLPRQPHLKSLV